jgi:hypothetical protein
MIVGRRQFLLFVPAVGLLKAAGSEAKAFRGKLSKDAAGKAVLEQADGHKLFLSGDDDTVGVLKDKRLAGADFEVLGVLAGDTVTIQPIHEAALFAWRDGKRLRVTYWCDICAIRTYTPGLCWCCREETDLDLRQPDTVGK